MKYRILFGIGLFAVLFSVQSYCEENKECSIYAAVIGYTPPPLTAEGKLGTVVNKSGIYKVSMDGRDMKYLGAKVPFGLDVYPEACLMYAATKNGVLVSKNSGETWRNTCDWTMTEIQHVITLKDNHAVIYAGTPYGLFKSTEYGENFKKLTKKFVECLLVDPVNSDKIYLGQEDGLYVSSDAGVSFSKVNMDFGSEVNAFAIDPKSPDKMYVGTEDKGIFTSTDGGKTWQQAKSPADKVTVFGLTVDPANPDRIFAATFKDGILRSTDGGSTWQLFKKGLEDNAAFCILTDPADPKVIYAGCSLNGVMKSTDNGESWQKFALDNAQVWKIQIR